MKHDPKGGGSTQVDFFKSAVPLVEPMKRNPDDWERDMDDQEDEGAPDNDDDD